MESKLKELSLIYIQKKKENKNLFRYKNPHLLSIHQINKDGFEIAIKHHRVELDYSVVLFISDDDKVVLNTPIIVSNKNLNEEYNQAVNDIENLSIEDFLEKYYDSIIKILKNAK